MAGKLQLQLSPPVTPLTLRYELQQNSQLGSVIKFIHTSLVKMSIFLYDDDGDVVDSDMDVELLASLVYG